MEKDKNVLDCREFIEKWDPLGMTTLIAQMPLQWQEAEGLARQASMGATKQPDHVVILGVGGSAIGGDLVRAVLETVSPVPIAVNRDYTIPAYVGPRTLVVASSYSGGTDETMTGLAQARARGAQVVAITSGGQLEQMARENSWPLIKIPGGISPRAAVGYSFVSLLVFLERLGLCEPLRDDLSEAIEVMEAQRQRFSPNVNTDENPAKQIALALMDKVPLIYGSEGWKGTVAYRWKCQINENAKAPAIWNVFPELNHNETVGWESPRHLTQEIHVVMLRDHNDERRIQARIETTRELMSPHVAGVSEVWAEGKSAVARLASLFYPGDWVSLYLALLYRNDPTPIHAIDELKSRLAQL